MTIAIERQHEGVVLARATIRASVMLGLTGLALANTLGISEGTASRICRGEMAIDPNSKPGKFAILLVRVYRSLDALVGIDDRKRLLWMTGHNNALNGVPHQLIQRAGGLITILRYLDGAAAPT